jgi:hypothetical protein
MPRAHIMRWLALFSAVGERREEKRGERRGVSLVTIKV